MFRLTLILSAALYASFVIYSEPRSTAGAEVTRAAGAVDPLLSSAPSGAGAPEHLALADGRRLEIAAVIEPVDLHERGDGILTVSTLADDEVVITSASEGLPDLPIVEVTGSRVNLRAGPSTGNRVLGALSEGQQAELLDALDNGWSHVRAVESGVEGYMAARFLAPVD